MNIPTQDALSDKFIQFSGNPTLENLKEFIIEHRAHRKAQNLPQLDAIQVVNLFVEDSEITFEDVEKMLNELEA